MNTAARPSPAALVQSEEKPSATRVSDVTVRNFPPPHKQIARRSGNSEHIGNDVVIRHFDSGERSSETAGRAELKHYSDMDN